MELDVALRLPRDTETVSVVRSFGADALRRLGVTEHCVDDIRLALSEAVTNVLELASSDDDYEVRLRVRDGTCVVTVVDCGRGFDAGALASSMPGPSSPRGRGVAIMRAVLDGVGFDSHPEHGTIAHLTKQLEVVPGSPLDRLRQTRSVAGAEVDVDRLPDQVRLPGALLAEPAGDRGESVADVGGVDADGAVEGELLSQ